MNSIYHFPLALEFYSLVWSINLLCTNSPSWSSGEGVCHAVSQGSLLGQSCSAPWQGAGLSVNWSSVRLLFPEGSLGFFRGSE